MKKYLLYLLPLALIIALPIMLRKPAEAIDPNADQLVIISSHNDAIKYETEQAFRKYYFKKTGRKVSIDWRDVGGTGDTVRYLDSAFSAAFKQLWTVDMGQSWSHQVSVDYKNPRVSPEKSAPRKAFLESNVGIGIDVFFGGGQYDHNKQARIGNIVPMGVQKRHPEWFSGSNAPMLFGDGGEIWHDKQDRYYATCFSTFGICLNLDRMKALGFDIAPQNLRNYSWTLLGDPRLNGNVGLADPTKSGSINKCFEMLVQKQMQETMKNLQPQLKNGKLTQTQALDEAWLQAMTLIKKAGGNARYLTFSAGKVPVDCASGQVAAGMAIDFYGRSQAAFTNSHNNQQIMFFMTPHFGSSVSADPISILRGAPNRQRAEMFVDFILSEEGQRLWNFKVGTPGGPIKYNLHRLPVRKDLYLDELKPYMTAPDEEVFNMAAHFHYQASWTSPYFSLLRVLIKIMVIDCQPELQSAWNAILQAGGPTQCPKAMEYFQKLPFDHHQASQIVAEMNNPEKQTVMVRQWGDFFRKAYKQAELEAKKL